MNDEEQQKHLDDLEAWVRDTAFGRFMGWIGLAFVFAVLGIICYLIQQVAGM